MTAVWDLVREWKGLAAPLGSGSGLLDDGRTVLAGNWVVYCVLVEGLVLVRVVLSGCLPFEIE